MGVMDFEVQRERRIEILREARSRRLADSRQGVRALSRLAGLLAISR